MIQEILERQEPVVYQILKNALKRDHLAHSYLLSGEKNPLKLKTAFLMAQSIIEGRDDFACETCERCERIVRREYFDVIFVDGEEETIKKEKIEHIFEEFQKTSLEKGGKKVYIIQNINHASLKVLNMILKFMEEPSSKDVYGIFITDQIDQLLPTIVSRCQILPFRNSDFHFVEELYVERGFDEMDAYFLSRIHHDVIDLDLNDASYLLAKDLVFETIDHLKDSAYLPILFSTQLYSAFKKNDKGDLKNCQNYYLEMMLILLHDALARVEVEDVFYQKKMEELRRYGLEALIAIFQEIKDIAMTNVDRRLLFDRLAYAIISVQVRS